MLLLLLLRDEGKAQAVVGKGVIEIFKSDIPQHTYHGRRNIWDLENLIRKHVYKDKAIMGDAISSRIIGSVCLVVRVCGSGRGAATCDGEEDFIFPYFRFAERIGLIKEEKRVRINNGIIMHYYVLTPLGRDYLKIAEKTY